MRQFIRRFQPFFLYAAFFSLVINVLMLMPALFMLQVYDRVVTSRSHETLVMLLVLTIGALVFMAFLDVVRSRLLARAGVALEKVLGPSVLADMIRRSALPNAPEPSNGLRDVASLRAFLSGPGIIALFDSPWMPIYLTIIYLFHPLLGTIALGGAAALFLLAYLNEKLSRRPLEAMQLESRRANRFADQSMSTAEVASTLGMVEGLTRGWHALSRGVLALQLKASRHGSFFTSATRFLRQTLQIAMLGAGAYLVIEQVSTPGVMIAATILLGRALAPVESAVAGWKSLVDARSAYARLDKFLAESPATGSATKLPAPTGALSVERLAFGFRHQERPVLKGVTFKVEPGEMLAIVGPSAAGKSTLARLLVGLWKPSAGTVRLDGADVSNWPRAQLGPHIGYLPQDVELFDGTVSENIARLGEVDSEMVIEAATRANAHEMILRLPQGYDTQIGEGGAALSGGQRQRIALARALYGRPRFVVLDEPNSNLDSDGEVALLEAIRALKGDGVTVIVITHRPMLLVAVDKVMLLREGMVQKFGRTSEVLRPPQLHDAKTEPSAVIAGQIMPKP